MTPSVEQRQAESQCRACGITMSVPSRFCDHCLSWQDWRRHLQFSSTVLSLLIALISVTSIAVPWLWSTMAAENSDIQATIVRTGEKAGRPFDVQVLVANIGNRPGTMGQFHYRPRDGEWQLMDIPGYWMDESIEILPAGDSGFIYLSRLNPSGDLADPSTLSPQFEVKLEVIEFDTSRKSVVLPFPVD